MQLSRPKAPPCQQNVLCYLFTRGIMIRKILILIFVLLFCIVPSLEHDTYANISPPEYTKPRIIKTGQASWYSETDPGINIHTANNEVFDDSGLTAAMWDVPFHQMVKVTNLNTGQSVVVRINDRGPHRRFVRQGRIIDLTKQAFDLIGDLDEGLIPIQLELL